VCLDSDTVQDVVDPAGFLRGDSERHGEEHVGAVDDLVNLSRGCGS
jgi:hypothetical protein